MIEFVLLTAAFLAVGYTCPWWAILGPAIVYGVWSGGGISRPQRNTKALALVVTSAVALAWCVPAVIQDFEVAGRVSARLAGLMGLKGGVFAYLFIIVLAALSANLGLAIGMNLRQAVPLLSSPVSAEDKPED